VEEIRTTERILKNMWSEEKQKEYEKYGSKGKVTMRNGKNNFIIDDVENNTLNYLDNFIEQEDIIIEKPLTNRLKTENTSNDRPDWAKSIIQFDESNSVLADGQKRKYGNLLLGNSIYRGAGDQSEPRWKVSRVKDFYYFTPVKNFSGNMGDLLIYPNDEENDWDVYDGLSKFTQTGLMCAATDAVLRRYYRKGYFKNINTNTFNALKVLRNKIKNILFTKRLDNEYNELKIRRIYLVEPYDKLFEQICDNSFCDNDENLDELVKTKFNDEYFRRLAECFKEHINVQQQYIESFKDSDGNIDYETGVIKLGEYYSWFLNNFWQTIKTENTREECKQTMICFNYYSNPWHDLQNMNQIYDNVNPTHQELIKNLWTKAKQSIIKNKDEENLYRVSLWNFWAKGKKDTGESWVKGILSNARSGLYNKNPQSLIDYLTEIKETSDLYNEWVETKDERKKQLKEFTGIGEVMPILLSTERNITNNDDKYKIIHELTRFMLTKSVISFKKEWNPKWTEIARIMCDDNKLESEKVDETIEIIKTLIDDNKKLFEPSLVELRNNDSRTKEYGYELKEKDFRLNGMKKINDTTFRYLLKYFINLLEDKPLHSPIDDVEHMFEVKPDMGVAKKLNCIDSDGNIDYIKYYNYSQRISTTYPWNKSYNRGNKDKYKDKCKLYETSGSHMLQRTQKRLVNPKGYLKKIDSQLAEPFGSNITEDKLNDYHKAFCKLITKLFYENN